MKRKDIEESLIKQLESKRAAIDHFLDMINDYMSMWDMKNALISDINTRGVSYTDMSSTGVPMMKNNPSVKELVMVNKQMLSILKELGLSTADVGVCDGEDEM